MKKLIPLVLIVIVFASCGKNKLNYIDRGLTEYAPLEVGKYLTYRLDSLIFTNFGTVEAHKLYDVKYTIEDTITDILGRKAHRVVRYIKPINGGSFTPDNTCTAVNTQYSHEFTENNLRYIKFVRPYKKEQVWKGNSAIDVSSLGTNLQYLFNWDYKFDAIDIPNKIGNFSFDSTIVINHIDRVLNVPIQGPNTTNPTSIATKDFGQEIYAAGLGMVYRKFLHWEYQYNVGNNNGKYEGYGVTLTLIDHN
jgi:hypothetical protein